MGAPSTNRRHLLLEDRPPPSTPALQRLPGKATPRQEVLRECEAETAEMRGRIPRVLGDFLIPDLTRAFRWRLQLDCGCVPEVLTREDYAPPHEMRSGRNTFTAASRTGNLPARRLPAPALSRDR